MNVASANRAAAAALFDALYAGGVRHVCISPGSRSTPLVLAVASQSRFRCWVITDERSSAYFALGLARATGDAVAVITTSGTAVANLVPAASEAMRARVPLVFVTADRPRETRDSGAPQTIAQAGALFSHVRFQADLVTPFAGQADLTRYYRAVAARALAVARGIEPGPVHLNVPLREPLLDERDLQGSPERERAVSEAVAHVRVERGELGLGEALAGELAEQLSRRRRGLIVAGWGAARTGEEARAIAGLARRLGWPVLADPLSGLAGAAASECLAVGAAEVLLGSKRFCQAAEPELILRLGGVPAARAVQDFVGRSAAEQFVVAPYGEWPDPWFRATQILWTSSADWARSVGARLEGGPADRSWLDLWSRAAAAAASALGAAASQHFELEGAIAAAVCQEVGPEGVLWVGNSMPVRDVGEFVEPSRRPRLYGNRGASGIDGTISSALGLCAGLERPTTLLTGDLAFLHDVGGLQIAARYGLDLTVVAINNDGGGIFEFLPQARLGATFEEYFATPHGLSLEAAAALGRGRHWRAADRGALTTALREARRATGLRVVEVIVQRAANRTLRERAIQQARAAVEKTLGELL